MNKTIKDKIYLKRRWTIERFASQADYEANNSYEKSIVNHNLLVKEGINELFTILCSAGGTEFDNTNAYLITGTGSGAAADTDVEGTFTAGVAKGMEAGYPTYGTLQKAIWRSVFAAGDANQAWAEFGVMNASTGGKLLNRLVSAQGTKTAGQVWQLTFEISLS